MNFRGNSAMGRAVATPANALLTPDPERKVRCLMGLPVGNAGCPGISGLPNSTRLLPRWVLIRRNLTCAMLHKRTGAHALVYSTYLLCIVLHDYDGRLLNIHGLQPLACMDFGNRAAIARMITAMKQTRCLWTYKDCWWQPLRLLLLLLPRCKYAAKQLIGPPASGKEPPSNQPASTYARRMFHHAARCW